MFSWIHLRAHARSRGFTLIELVVVLAILGILIALAVPRYLSARKQAYRSEADDILQESKTLEWMYYQQYNAFDVSGSSIGLTTPSGMHWSSPSFDGGSTTQITILMSGTQDPVGAGDSVWITLSNDGSSSGASTF